MTKKFPRYKSSISLQKDFFFFAGIFSSKFNSSDQKIKTLDALKSYFRREVTFVSSYRMGLYYCLKSLKIESGFEVIIGPIQIPDAINAILLNGGVPVFADLSRDSHIITLEQLVEKVSSKTKVVVITYLSGLAPKLAELKDIQNFCESQGIVLIEDITQAYGISIGDQLPGSFSKFAIGSLSPTKLITSTLGGIILTNKEDAVVLGEEITEKVMPSKFLHTFKHGFFLIVNLVTTNLFFSSFIFYIIKLKELNKKKKKEPNHWLGLLDPFNDEFLKKRRDSFPADFYFKLNNWHYDFINESLSELESVVARRRKSVVQFLSLLDEEVKKSLPENVQFTNECSYYHFPIYLPKKAKDIEEFRIKMLEDGIDLVGYLLNLCTEEVAFGEFAQQCPTAKMIKNRCLFIPLHESYSEKDNEVIAQKINSIFKYYS